MRDGARKWLIRSAWTGLVAAGALLLGLRLGRPLYYTDGQREHIAPDIKALGMWQWPTPEPAFELPGPVVGRIARLADGRLLYGRGREGGDTDLVLFDPQRREIEPEPAFALNSPHHELAPAVAGDGAIYFASDRPGGAGGFDLYSSRLGSDGFAPPSPVAACNTMRDETDPAPSPDGGLLVFARIDPVLGGDRDGVLFGWRLDAGDPEPLFGTQPIGALGRRQPVDRDPAFAVDGSALWFLRRSPGGRAQIVRSACLEGRFDVALPIDAGWGGSDLRSPLPTRDRLWLLRPRADAAGQDTLLVSHGRELAPWWLGQEWLERLLLGALLAAAALLVLLYLGRRWRSLDLVTTCLLLSLLVHLLVMLWLMGVEIQQRLQSDGDEGGALQVTLVSDAGSADGGGRQADPAVLLHFQPQQRDLAAAAPAAALAPAPATAVPAGAGELPALATNADATPAAPQALRDEAAAIELRAGVDPVAGVPAAAVPDVAPSPSQAQPARGPADALAVDIPMPRSGLEASERPRGASIAIAAGAPALPGPQLDGGAAAPAAAQLRDQAGTVAVRAGTDAAAALPAASLPAVARSQDQAQPARGPAAALAVDVPLPRSGLEASERPRGSTVPIAAGAPALPGAQRERGAAPAAPQLHDQAGTVAPRAATDASAGPPAALTAASLPVVARSQDQAQPARAPADALAVAVPLPRSGLDASQRPRGAATALPAASPMPATALPLAGPRSVASPRAAVRDAASAAAALAGPRPEPDAAAAKAGERPALERVAAATVAPIEAGPPRPLRAQAPTGTAVPAVAPPGSLLARAPARASEPLPQPAPAVQPKATAYSNRFGPAKVQALERFGGTADTERAVRDGLRYLAKIQRGDGAWGDTERFDDKYGHVYVGKTGLCLLAFLGAGHTPTSKTEHSGVVARAVARLLALQDEATGAFGSSSAYGHGIATYALAECFGMTKDRALRSPVERALTWILEHQGPRTDRRNRGGWGYFSPGLQPEDDYARSSITAWMVMALESARLSGIELPETALPRAREFLQQAFDQQQGWFRYNHKRSRLQSGWPTLPASTPAAAFCLQLLGDTASDPAIATAIEYTVARAPEEYRRYEDDEFVQRGQGNVYFWYYGTLCCFLAGGDAWQRWNERLRTLLPAAQDQDGSFAPIDVYAQYAGDTRRDRSYTTAMCVLSLEIYYRYFTPLLLGR